MSNSINTNISAYFAQANLTTASNDASSSVARLSSGNRIVKASDDVASLATGTSLLSTVSALKAAQSSASQGSSLLQVADGALAQIQNILQQQKSIALQARSGSLTNSDRGFLNQQFQALADQINSLSDSTSFNGVSLINGSLSNSALVDDVTTQSKTATASINLSTNPVVSGDTITIAGVQLTATTSATPTSLQFKIGATAADTVGNLAAKLTALAATPTYATSLGKASFTALGSQLQINARTGGELGNNFAIDTSAANSSLISGTKAVVSGAFGGSTVNLFANTGASLGFTSATASITSATPTAASPFKGGDSITATIGGGTSQSLYTLANGDSLTTIVNGINVNATTTGIHASLTFDASSKLYNIQLHSNSATGAFALNGGANFYNVGDKTHGLNGATQTQTLFTNEYAVNNVVAGNTVVGASLAAPFVNGDSIQISVGTGSAETVATVATGDKLADLVTKINASAGSKTLGLSAALSSNGQNIDLTYSDSTGANNLLINGGTNFFNTDATGLRNTNGLNNHVSTLNLFAAGYATSATAVSAATSATATPFQDGDTVSVTVPGLNSGNPITLGTVSASSTLAGLATSINASANALANGIHAEVVQDSSGLFNISLNVATNTAANLTFSGGTNFFAGATTHGINPAGASTFGAPDQTQSLFNATFAATLTAGQTVSSAATATASVPFKQGDTLSVTTANGSVNISTALAAGDTTLQKIADNINARAVAGHTGVTAALTADGKNINLTSATKILSFQGGTNFYSNAADTTGVVTNSGLNNNATSIDLFNPTLAAAIKSGANHAYVLSAGASTATIPFKDGDVVTLSVNGGSTINISTALAVGTTVDQLIANINATATAQAAGVHATFDAQDSTHSNIKLVVDGQTNQAITNLKISTANINTTNLTPYTTVVSNNVQTAATATTVGTATSTTALQQVYGLNGGENTGLGYNSVSVSGTVGDNLLTALSQTPAKILVSFPDIDPAALTATGNFGSDGSVYITAGGHKFAFTTTVSNAKAADEITIGSTLRETLDNAVATINNYAQNNAVGNEAYDLNQITVSRSGNSLVFQGKGLSNPTKSNGAALDAITVSAGFTNGAVSSNSGLLNNAAANFGVDASALSNKDFNGFINGFKASFTGTANTVNLSVKVGNYTYTASNVPTAPTSNTTIRLTSDVLNDGSSGGYFDIQLAGNQGQSVNSDPDAKTIEQRLNLAFSSLSFSQTRTISTYNGTQSIVSNGARIGTLIGSKVSAQLASFSGNKLTGITVTAPTTSNGDAKISLTVDGEEFQTTAGLGTELGATQTYRLTSTTNASHFIDFTTGSSIDISTAANAQAVQKALGDAFGTAKGDGALSFQVGATSNDTIAVSIGSAKTSQIYDGQTLDVATQESATTASAVLDEAIKSVTALRASVGAYGSRFNFASAALQSSVQNQDAARAQLLDTDIALESTAYATSQVKLQAGISVLAQANQALQALLKLIG